LAAYFLDLGFPDALLTQMGEGLTTNSSMLVALVDAASKTRAGEVLAHGGGVVMASVKIIPARLNYTMVRGDDFADYSESTGPVTVNLETGAGSNNDAAGDSLSGIEGVVGSDYDDSLVGAGGNETLIGSGGNDTLMVDGGGGAQSRLVLYGDTSQDGTWYSGVPGETSRRDNLVLGAKLFDQVATADDLFRFPRANPFDHAGNDFIDASALFTQADVETTALGFFEDVQVTKFFFYVVLGSRGMNVKVHSVPAHGLRQSISVNHKAISWYSFLERLFNCNRNHVFVQ
jgi:hypothetical protein